MAKQTITITVDSDVIEEIRQLKINISGEINEFLKGILARYNEDVEGINIQLERIRYEKALKKQTHWQNQAKVCLAKIEKWQEVKDKEKEEELSKEKEKMEAMYKCKNCGTMLDEQRKKYEFKIGYICNGCYMSADSKQIKKWMGT